ncbi:MAG: hypothetical protein WCL47_08995 [Holophagaceae bacterium]
MISPLGQRQILQTASLETARQALEGGVQAQREQARKAAFDAKLAEAMLDVPEISHSESMLLKEHGKEEQGAASKHGTGASEDLPVEPDSEATPAVTAGPHLDLLA